MTSISPIHQSIPVSPRPARRSEQAVDQSNHGDQENQQPPQAAENRSNSDSGLAYKTRSELSEEEIRQIRELKQRDREVKAHEQAHLAAASSLARGGPSFKYQRGPDGRQYAVGGEVNIDISEEAGDPDATIEKAQRIRRAALAPANPSAKDRSVASAATRLESEARAELAQQSSSEKADSTPQADPLGANTTAESSSICSECGGQHTPDSHSKATQLQHRFSSIEQPAQRPVLNVSA